MGEYFDSAYVAADGVILFYEDDDVSLQIPGKMGDMDIHTIGDGAFMESETIQYVNLPYGLKSIGQNAFKGSRRLQCLNIPSTVEQFGNKIMLLRYATIWNTCGFTVMKWTSKSIWR